MGPAGHYTRTKYVSTEIKHATVNYAKDYAVLFMYELPHQ